MISEKSKDSLTKTRFAPSPTGSLHMGSARTALFNYILARNRGGRFILRIEDTDKKRNKTGGIKEIKKDLLWLGLKPSESISNKGKNGYYKQTERLEIYWEKANLLLEKKKAYYCFCSKKELEIERENFYKSKKAKNYQYSRKCNKLSEEEISAKIKSQKNYVLRLKIEKGKKYTFEDIVRGKISFASKDIEDFILIRENKMPNYNFACVIDDHLMEITHILRGEEHLSNTGKQLALYEAFGWKKKTFGHLSMILDEDKKKLSKRNEDDSSLQLIKNLREKGYLASAINNYLLLLGWHPGTNREFFSIEEAIESFDHERFHSEGAVFSIKKLNWFNNFYIKKLEKKEFEKEAWKRMRKFYDLKIEDKYKAITIADLLRDEIDYLEQLVELSDYFFLNLEKKKIEQLLEEGEKNYWFYLEKISEEFSKIENWTEKIVKEKIKEILEKKTFEKKRFFPLLRKVLTGKENGIGLTKIIVILGKKEVLERLKIKEEWKQV